MAKNERVTYEIDADEVMGMSDQHGCRRTILKERGEKSGNLVQGMAVRSGFLALSNVVFHFTFCSSTTDINKVYISTKKRSY